MGALVLLSDPFAQGSGPNLSEGVGGGKNSALDRRLAFIEAWQGQNKPEPQVGQVWVIAAREVVVTETLTHYNTPDRLAMAEPRLRWRSRPKGKTGVESISIFTQRYAPAWLPGDSPLTEDVLDETVQQLRKYLDGKHQVLDLGTIGLFRTYVVTPVSDDYLFSTLQYAVPGGKQGKQAAEAWLKQTHPFADYLRARRTDAMNSPYSWAGTEHDFIALKSNVEEASRTITALGIPRQRDTLIVLDLSKDKNPITGGGVGGYAYRRSHAIEADGRSMTTPYGVELLVHEWAHKKFFNLPQHVTRYVADWFKENVANDPRIKDAPRVPTNQRGLAVSLAWEGFRDSWAKWEGVAPDEYLQFKARTEKTVYGDTSPFVDAMLRPGRTAVGRLRKSITATAVKAVEKRLGLPQDDAPETIRSGSKVWAMSARAVHPDAYIVIPTKGGAPVGSGMVHVTLDMLRDVLEIDVKASAEKNGLDVDRLTYRVRQMQTPPEPADDRTDRFFTRESLVYGSLDDALRKATDWLKQRGVDIYPSDVFPIDNHSKFTDEWIAAAEKQGDKFDAEKTFRALFEKHVTWDAPSKLRGSVEQRLTTAEGKALRDLAASLKITPSSYAASNVDELWAELIAHTAMRPNDVPKPLKALLRNALQGKTPGPGQRVKQDNTPPKYRTPVREAVVLVSASPFGGLDEMHKHGNKRSHASRVRAYKKSGRMVAQTFSTPSAAGRSNAADAVIDYAREGDAAYNDDKPQSANPYDKGTPEYGGWGNGWMSAWKVDYRNGYDAGKRKRSRDSNPNDKGTNAHKAWSDGWNDNAAADAREANEGRMNEAADSGYIVPADYVLLRVTSHRQRDKLTSAFGKDGLSLMAYKPGESILDRVEAIAVPAKLAAKMGSDTYPWRGLKAPKLRKGYLVSPWSFGGDYGAARDWLKQRGFTYQERTFERPGDVAEAVVLLDRNPFA